MFGSNAKESPTIHEKGWWETWWGQSTILIVTGLIVGFLIWGVTSHFDKPIPSAIVPPPPTTQPPPAEPQLPPRQRNTKKRTNIEQEGGSTYTVENPVGSIVNQASVNLGTQTVNNAPPSRIPADEQIIKFKSLLAQTHPEFMVRVFPAGSSDDVEPTVAKMIDALNDVHWPNSTAGYVGYGGGPIASAEGIECYSDSSLNMQRFLKAMDALGLKCKLIHHDKLLVGDVNSTSRVTVLIGRQPR